MSLSLTQVGLEVLKAATFYLRSLLAEGESVLSEQPESCQPSSSCGVVVAKFQNLLTVALAMLSQAHLNVLKRFHAKFLELVLAKPRDQHLRAPSLSEILDADSAAWTAVIELFYDFKWSLNDVLNEVAFCRQVFHTSLAPRPEQLPTPRQDPPQRRRELPKPLPKKQKPESPANDSVKPAAPPPKSGKWDNSWLCKLPDGKGISLGCCVVGCVCSRVAHLRMVLRQSVSGTQIMVLFTEWWLVFVVLACCCLCFRVLVWCTLPAYYTTDHWGLVSVHVYLPADWAGPPVPSLFAPRHH